MHVLSVGPELIAADAGGVLHRWHNAAGSAEGIQLGSSLVSGALTVECLESLHSIREGTVAVSTSATSAQPITVECLSAPVSEKGSVVLVDLRARVVMSVLQGHSDIVPCMCATPDGRLVTAGGKLDTKVKVWDQTQWDGSNGVVVHDAAQELKEPGYVFALIVVEDTKPESRLFTLAAARYNQIKICI